MNKAVSPTVVVVLGDGTVETTYYSDQPIRLIVVEPDLESNEPADTVIEPLVFDLADANFSSSVSERIKSLRNEVSQAITQ